MNLNIPTGFSGSYSPEDCTFLLKLLSPAQAQALEVTDLGAQEKAIQSGVSPYWMKASREKPPSEEFNALYRASMNSNKVRFAANVASLTKQILSSHSGAVTLVSLARAGTPVGVLLNRALKHCGRTSSHYSISIIREKTIGLDCNALAEICRLHDSESIVFVDGWTGKGGMSRQLEESVSAFNQTNGTRVSPNLYVVSDLAGYAYCSGDYADYLLPYSIFNGVISGLVSRTIYNPSVVSKHDFHAAYLLDHLAASDISVAFVDEICAELFPLLSMLDSVADANVNSEIGLEKRRLSKQTVDMLLKQFGIADVDLIKVGIGESTRAMTRRLPQALIISDTGDGDVIHLLRMAEERGIKVIRDIQLFSGKAAVIVANANQ